MNAGAKNSPDPKSENKAHHVCPVSRADSLDTKWRRWFQNPKKILAPYVKEGMRVMDVGCGPGFFTIDMAEMVGESGRVIACDLQEGMLDKVRDKIKDTPFESRITLHRCEADRIGADEKVDFVLLMWMVHEVPNSPAFFGELESMLLPGGRILIVEPPFHVSKKAFAKMMDDIRQAGLEIVARPKTFLNKAVVAGKSL